MADGYIGAIEKAKLDADKAAELAKIALDKIVLQKQKADLDLASKVVEKLAADEELKTAWLEYNQAVNSQSLWLTEKTKTQSELTTALGAQTAAAAELKNQQILLTAATQKLSAATLAASTAKTNFDKANSDKSTADNNLLLTQNAAKAATAEKDNAELTYKNYVSSLQLVTNQKNDADAALLAAEAALAEANKAKLNSDNAVAAEKLAADKAAADQAAAASAAEKLAAENAVTAANKALDLAKINQAAAATSAQEKSTAKIKADSALATAKTQTGLANVIKVTLATNAAVSAAAASQSANTNLADANQKLAQAQADKLAADQALANINNKPKILFSSVAATFVARTFVTVDVPKTQNQLAADSAALAATKALRERNSAQNLVNAKIIEKADLEKKLADSKAVLDTAVLKKATADANLINTTADANNKSSTLLSLQQVLNDKNKINVEAGAEFNVVKNSYNTALYNKSQADTLVAQKTSANTSAINNFNNAQTVYTREVNEKSAAETKAANTQKAVEQALKTLNELVTQYQVALTVKDEADKAARLATRILNNIENGGPIVDTEGTSYATTEKYLQRPNHFEGQFVKEEHLLTEQDYLDFLRQTTNKYLNDISGVLTGFVLEIDKTTSTKINIAAGLGQYIDSSKVFSVIKEVCLLKTDTLSVAEKNLEDGVYVVYATTDVVGSAVENKDKPQYKKQLVQFDCFKKGTGSPTLNALRIGEFTLTAKKVSAVINYPSIQKAIRKINNFATAADGSVTITGEDVVNLANLSTKQIDAKIVTGVIELQSKVQKLENDITSLNEKIFINEDSIVNAIVEVDSKIPRFIGF